MPVRCSTAPRVRAVAVPALLLIASTLTITACSNPPPGIAPVLASNQDASHALADAYARDLAWLRASLAASLDTQRTILLGRTHRALIADGLITPIGHDPEALHKALDAAAGNAPPANPLLAEVHAGRLTRAQAERFLNDYAVAASMSPEPSRAIRHAMLADLAPLREHDDTAHAFLSAFDNHTARIAQLLSELDANNQTLAEAFDPKHRPPSPIAQRSFWLPILDHIEDPALRAAAEQLLTGTLTQPPPTP